MTISIARSPGCLVVALAAACSGSQPGTRPDPERRPPGAGPAYRATIRWTAHGIPHVTAADLGGLAFGQGYAFAAQHVCELADQVTKLRSERARLLGPGDRDENIESDFAWLALDIRGQAERGLPKLSQDARSLLAGYAAGYNKYLADTKPGALPADCANAAWVRPIDELDLLSHWGQVGVLGSSAFFLDSIAAAQPPGIPQRSAPPAGKMPSARDVEAPDLRRADAPASNGWGIGAERSETGHGLLVANPHFPWEGENRFYESHLTIPGSLDAYGATLLGLPLVSIGFNRDLAWTHTFSSSSRFVIYRLTLADGDPTKYRYGEETRAMTSREVAIQVRRPDGSLVETKRTVYRSHHGPILANSTLPWNDRYAYTIRDVAGGNLGSLDMYLAMMHARDLAGFEAALDRWQATGFVNTIYADRAGNAFYVDGSAVPDLSEGALGMLGFARKSIPALAEAWKRGIVIADGSMPDFDLASDPKSARPGAISYGRAPRLVRRDFVMNANDPYWLTNPAAPLTGFSPLYGETGKEPSARTRMNLSLLMAAGERAPAGADGKFSVAELQAAILDDRAMTAELLRAAVVARCSAAKKPDARAARACTLLAAWDGRYDAGSRGAIVWRELFAAYPGSMYAVPFDPAKPLDTPRGLAPAPGKGDDPLMVALRTAIERLESAGVDPGAALGDVQWVDKRGRRFPVHGSGAAEGATNPVLYSRWSSSRLWRMPAPELVNSATGLAKGGYPVNYGTSFLMVVGFTDAGPTARAILTYSASSDPRSPQYTDQTEMYGKKVWRTVLFTRADIDADAELRVQEVCAGACAP